MGIQFRLGSGDHKVVEDFVSRDARGVSAIILDTKGARHQRGAAEAAVRAGLSVFWDPAVERLADQGFGQEKYPLWFGWPYNLNELATSSSAREQLVQATIEAHPDFVSHVTAPHFYVENERGLYLNVALAEMMRLAQPDRPLRVVVTMANRAARLLAATCARELAAAGIREVELRLSPLGGEDESLGKIRDAFEALKRFQDAGLQVTLGHSGNIGQVAVALGLAHDYSVGVGLLERTDHKALINRQKSKPKPRTDDNSSHGALAGIYLPGIAATVPRELGKKLLNNTDIRTSIGCRIGSCGDSVRGPADDIRGHYLHAKAAEMAKLQEAPPSWRPTIELNRLRSARELRVRLNTHHAPKDKPIIKTRTVRSLMDGLEERRQAS